MLSQAGVSLQPVEVKDFSGGITDNFTGCPPNKYQKADNFYISDDGKLITRPGLEVNDTSNARTPNSLKIQHMFDSESQLFQLSDGKIFYNSSGFTTVNGPTGNKALLSGSSSTFYSATKWNKHVILADTGYSRVMKLFKDGSTWRAHELGLPSIASTPTITGTGSGNNYLYAFHYQYSYTSQGVTFEELGPAIYSTVVTNNNTPDATNIAISAIPVFSNSTTRNLDTTNLKVYIYRTTNDGTVYYKIGEVTNGTTTFTDNVADTNLNLNIELYTTSDMPDHDAPPLCKYVHQVNDILYCGAIKEGSIEYPNKLRLSNRFKLWSMPAEWEEEFDEDIMGISSVNIYPIVFCKNKIYRLEGFYLPDGSGKVTKRLISDTAGLVSNRSIVQTNEGLFFAGNEGFYFTDGNSCIRISEDINQTYRDITSVAAQKNSIYGTFDKKNQRILWAIMDNSEGTENDTIYVCHTRAGVKPDMPFTTWSGGTVYPSNFAPTSVFYYDGTVYHGDTNGYLLQYDDDAFSDCKINTSVAASSWLTTTIIYDHRTCSSDLGTGAIRKWIPLIEVNADNYSSVSMVISVNIDNSGLYREVGEFKYRGELEWGDYEVAWGDTTLRWNYAPIITGKRRIPKSSLRSTFMQIRFTNGYTEIETSTDLGTATFSNSANTAVLNTVANSWPSDVLDYYVSTASDSYDEQFRITARTSSTLTLEDLNGTIPDGSLAWKVKGYRRNEVIKILSYSLTYAITSQSQPGYRVET